MAIVCFQRQYTCLQDILPDSVEKFIHIKNSHSIINSPPFKNQFNLSDGGQVQISKEFKSGEVEY